MSANTPEPVTLRPLPPTEREAFITSNQEAFNYGSLIEFGQRNTVFEEDGQIISRTTIETAINTGNAYQILASGRVIGGLVVEVKGSHGSLELLFIAPDEHSKGYGQAAWALVEATYPQVEVWETFTPYFETRNVHFYVNKLGFEIVEFFTAQNPNPHSKKKLENFNQEDPEQGEYDSNDEHEDFLFVKELTPSVRAEGKKNSSSLEQRRVSYSDKETLHSLINQQGMRGVRYEKAGWLVLSQR